MSLTAEITHIDANWTRTAIEFAVFKALGLHGYSDLEPDCGYSKHAVMVPNPNGPQNAEDIEFTDFDVLTDESVFKAYVIDTLRHRGVAVGYVLDTDKPKANLVYQGQCVQVASDCPRRAVCLAVLSLYGVPEVPEAIHRFEAEQSRLEALRDVG